MLNKPACNWILIKDNVSDKVGALVAPVCDDALSAEFELHSLLPHALTRGIVLDLQNSLETSLCRHELEDRVHDQSATHLALESGGFEPGPDLETLTREIDGVLDVEESRSFADLLELCASECFLNDDVQKVLRRCVFRVLEAFVKLHLALSRFADDDGVLCAPVQGRKVNVLFKLLKSIDLAAGNSVKAKCGIQRLPLEAADLLNEVGVPHLHSQDFNLVRVSKHVATESEAVLVAHHFDLLLRDHGNQSRGGKLRRGRLNRFAAEISWTRCHYFLGLVHRWSH